MKRLILCTTVLLLLAGLASAEPRIVLRADPSKTDVGDGFEVRPYCACEVQVILLDADQLVGGIAYKIDGLDAPDIAFLGAWNMPGVVFGDMANGVEIGLYSSVPQFGSDPLVLGGFNIMVMDRLGHGFEVVEHPNYLTPIVANAQGIMMPASGGAITAYGDPEPETGLFFDEFGTQTEGSFQGGPGKQLEVWVATRRLDWRFDRVALSLMIPPGLTLVELNYNPEASVMGELPGPAILQFSPAAEAFGDDIILLAHMAFLVEEVMPETIYLKPLGHPLYDPLIPVFYDDTGDPFTGPALTSVLEIPVGNENSTWGRVKSLY